MTRRKIFLIAGEVSGDLHGALLVNELRKLDPALEFHGLGGEAMRGAGVSLLYDLPSIAALGFGDVLRNYLKFRRIFYDALEKVRQEIRPHLIILIDYPGFNIRFAKKIGRRIPIAYYISPQVWAWGKRRINTIARCVDRMLVLLPFEVDVYRGSGLDCRFVGHPLLDLVKPTKSPSDLAREWNLNGRKWISLLPGSREQEVKRILPVMLGAARLLHRKFPETSFLLTETPSLRPALYDSLVQHGSIPLKRVRNRTYDALACSDFALVTSGTATLEAAISLKPFVIIYKTGSSTYFLGKHLIRIPYIGLVNVLAGKKIVPEFIQQDATPEKIARAAEGILLDDQCRSTMIEEMKRVRDSLGGPGAAGRAAQAAVDLMNRR